MARSRLKTRLAMAAFWLAAAAALPGCTSWPGAAAGGAAESALAPAAVAQAALPSTASIPSTTVLQASESGQPVLPQTDDPLAMQRIVAEIQALGELDPQARDELLENLRQTDPTIWPLVAQRVRADLAWRRQAEQGEAERPGRDISRNGPPVTPAPSMGTAASRPPNREPLTAQPPSESTEAGGALAADEGPQPAADASGRPRVRVAENDPPIRDLCRPDELAAKPASHEEPSAAGRDAPVTPVSYQAKEAEGWQEHLDRAVELLESEVPGPPQSDRQLAQHARLRLLHLLGGRRGEALRPIPSLAPPMQEFWSKELYGLATLLTPELISDSGRRKAEASRHLNEAVAKLGESCPLIVRNPAFVTEIQSFGTYKPFDKYEFVPGQRVLLYAELENFNSIETPEGFHTATRSSYQIFDAGGKRVAEHQFSLCEEHCRRPRRDFFIVHDLHLPERIYPGKHVLQLTVADLNSEKIGQTVIEFTVKSGED
jgi:hypothetical protein